MGLKKFSGGTTFVNVLDGKFAVRVDGPGPDTTERKLTKGPNEGQVVHEQYYDSIEGTLVGGSVNTNDYGARVLVNLEDGEEQYVVDLPFNGLANQFAKRIPNLKAGGTVEFSVFKDDDQRTVLAVKQGGEQVKFAYTKDNPGDCPPPVKKKVKGKETWDWEAQEEFLYQKAVEFFNQFENPSDTVESPSGENTEEIPF